MARRYMSFEHRRMCLGREARVSGEGQDFAVVIAYDRDKVVARVGDLVAAGYIPWGPMAESSEVLEIPYWGDGDPVLTEYSQQLIRRSVLADMAPLSPA